MEEKEESKFKKVWKNKRSRALLQLMGYFVFFILVGVFIDFGSSSPSYVDKVSNVVSFSHYDNYAFYYNITYLGVVDEPVRFVNIDGYRYKEKNFLQIRGTDEKYYVEKEKVYQVKDTLEETESLFLSSLERLSPSFLHSYIAKATLESKTEYADRSLKKVYVLSVQDFMKLYNDEDAKVEGVIHIVTYEKDKTVYKVELDLTSYNKMLFELNYKEIGKIEPFYKEDLLSFGAQSD